FHPPSTTAISTLSLHDALPICSERGRAGNIYVTGASGGGEEAVLSSDQPNDPTDWSPDGRFLLFTRQDPVTLKDIWALPLSGDRSEEHTSELQSRGHLVCRLLL